MKESFRLFHSTGTMLIGTGTTMEEARLDLKDKVKAYRDRTRAGTYLKLSNPRDLRCLARPELADFLWKRRMKKNE